MIRCIRVKGLSKIASSFMVEFLESRISVSVHVRGLCKGLKGQTSNFGACITIRFIKLELLSKHLRILPIGVIVLLRR